MTNENNMTSFDCKDTAVDGCPNTVSIADTHCEDCAEFHASMAETRALLDDESWKPVDELPAPPSEIVLGFEVVEFKGDVDNLPVIIHAEQSDLVIVEEKEEKVDLDNVCYTMSAAEVDAQEALREIVRILRNLDNSLNAVDNALEIVESNCSQEVR